MPIYEYHCEKCGDFEVTQRISDAPMQRCPECRRKVRRLISSTSFQLKGSGWYVTDYARAGSKEKKTGDATKGTDGAAGASETKPSAKSETKTETKPEPKKKASGSAAAGSGGDA